MASFYRVGFFATALLAVVCVSAAVAQEASDPAPAQASAGEDLALRQTELADRYKRMEDLIFKMAEVEASTNPRRAALLKQAFNQSKERLVKLQMEKAAEFLTQKRVTDALSREEEIHKELNALLELLLTEVRPERLKDEMSRIKEYIKEAERIKRIQQGIRGRTEAGSEPKRLAGEQAKTADRAGELAKQIAQNEEGKPAEGQEGEKQEGEKQEGEKQEGEDAEGEKKQDGDTEGEPKKEGESGDMPSGEGQKKEGGEGQKSESDEGQKKEGGEGQKSESGEGQKKEGGEGQKKEPGEGEKKEPGEGQKKEPGEQGEPGEQNQEGEPSDQKQPGQKSKQKPQSQQGQQGQQGEQQEQQQQDQQEQAQQDDGNPARKRIQAAEEKMRQAQRKLEEAKRQESVQDQREAERELEKAIAELEEILRQLREEEIERTLRMLEARFAKMLEMQLEVYEKTRTLNNFAKEIPQDDADRFDREVGLPSGRLASEERRILVEADKALLVLQEEGSSVAFPETVEQMRDDIDQVVNRLAAAKPDKLTLGIEEDIIAALQDMVEALQKAQQDLQQQQQQGQPQQGNPEDQPLVDQIAELKMIRALQDRVRKRTNRYASLLDDEDDPVGQATDEELNSAIQKLSERQQSIHRVTRDIVLGKNQ